MPKPLLKWLVGTLLSVSTNYNHYEHALQAAKGSLRENGKLILCLSDNSLLEMIDIKVGGEQEPAEFLSTVLDDLLLHLEKQRIIYTEPSHQEKVRRL